MPIRLPLLLLAALVWSASTLPAQDGGRLRRAANPLDPAAAATNAVDRRLAGKTPGPATINLWAARDMAGGKSFTWNKDLWCADLLPYLTCFSPWNSNEHELQAGTLLTPRHALFAEHFSGASGSNTLHARDAVHFVGLSGSVYIRTLQTTPVRVGGTDLCIGTLDSDLPADVTPAQVLPAGLPPDFLPAGTPVLFTNGRKELRVAEVASFGATAIASAAAPNRVGWTVAPNPAIVGDSGSPVFVVLDDRPVLWFIFHTPGGGESISMYLRLINAMLGDGYRLEVAHVSGI